VQSPSSSPFFPVEKEAPSVLDGFYKSQYFRNLKSGPLCACLNYMNPCTSLGILKDIKNRRNLRFR
jgi:hypothetical protein